MKDHDVWNLGNSILLALEPQARVLNASLANGTQLTRNGFTSANSYDVNAFYKSDNVAGYISDEWKIGKLRLDGGVRVEHEKLRDTYENSSTGDLDNNPLTAYNNGAVWAFNPCGFLCTSTTSVIRPSWQTTFRNS